MQSRLMRLSGQSSRAGGGGGSSSSSNGSDSGQSSRAGGGGAAGGSALRKGPWTAEEDEILVEYVRKNGPRDWSSIRSKGLLPRTGKSCRLRWVNKLKPDLKTGCKFTAEEERVVIELQAQLGNKWARIATYLPGRTDNDVKNFWSTRQKRLARILRTPLPPKSAAAATKSTTTSSTPAAATTSQGKQRLLQPPSPLRPPLPLPLPLPHDQYASASHILLQDPCSDHLHLFDGVEDDSRYRCMIIDLPQMPEPLSCCPSMLEFDAPPPLLAVSAEPCSPFLTAPSQPALDHHHLLPQPLLGLPPDLALYQCQDPHFYDQLLPEELPFFGVKRSEQETALPVPDNFFFDDLPPDMFDFIDRPPPPPPPPPTTKSC